MSQANIPNITPVVTLTLDTSINLLLASIALEELGLAHIINTQGEKMQYVLGTLPGRTPPPVTITNILDIDHSTRSTLQAVIKKEIILHNKLESVIEILQKHKYPLS